MGREEHIEIGRDLAVPLNGQDNFGLTNELHADPNVTGIPDWMRDSGKPSGPINDGLNAWRRLAIRSDTAWNSACGAVTNQ